MCVGEDSGRTEYMYSRGGQLQDWVYVGGDSGRTEYMYGEDRIDNNHVLEICLIFKDGKQLILSSEIKST